MTDVRNDPAFQVGGGVTIKADIILNLASDHILFNGSVTAALIQIVRYVPQKRKLADTASSLTGVI